MNLQQVQGITSLAMHINYLIEKDHAKLQQGTENLRSKFYLTILFL